MFQSNFFRGKWKTGILLGIFVILLLELKLDSGTDNKVAIQKVQQAMDGDTYGAKEYRMTRRKIKPSIFLKTYANPPKLNDFVVEVYLYLGLNYIEKIQPNKEEKEYK